MESLGINENTPHVWLDREERRFMNIDRCTCIAFRRQRSCVSVIEWENGEMEIDE
jgi:hypothetical protein